ncbi:hypothetical protein KC614_01040 [candidate division WWE3 bacterium]|uniref:Uncharacterized protein n=1 Tax=candidate division WWE3 bacterium TaxID=2053526 RepID=A0A955LKY7_UNCKA|nr:hypothetical protein [candidate division WWE3 bacterium]
MAKLGRGEKSVILLLILVLAGVVSRVVPHAPNFTPVSAIILFSCLFFDKKLVFLIPILTMLVSDVLIGTHTSMLYTWGAFLLVGVIGYFTLRMGLSAKRVLVASLASSIIFYVVSNFGVWMEGWLYPQTFQGLVECYVMAIPFFRNTLLGDLFYSGMFYAAYRLVIYLSGAQKLAYSDES